MNLAAEAKSKAKKNSLKKVMGLELLALLFLIPELFLERFQKMMILSMFWRMEKMLKLFPEA